MSVSQTTEYLSKLGSKDAALHARAFHRDAKRLLAIRGKVDLTEEDKLMKLWIFGGMAHGTKCDGSLTTLCGHVSFGNLRWYYSDDERDAPIYLYMKDKLKAGENIKDHYHEVGYAIGGMD